MSAILRPRQWFKSAPDQVLPEIVQARSFDQNIRALRVFGLERGASTGWRSVDELYSVRPREWTLVTGIPSHGKSSWLDALMVNLYQKHDWRFAIFSAENMPLERHAVSLMSIFGGKPVDQMNDLEFSKALADVDHFTFICPHEEDYTIERVLELASMACSHDAMIQGVVIDPWNELDHSRPPSMNETEYISRCLTRVRRFARAHEVHVFVVAHPTKLKKNLQDVYPVPTPYDVSGSAHFRNKADNCICVWRDVEDPRNETTLYVQKIRFREIGKVGQCTLAYDWRSGRFVDQKPSIDDYMSRREREPGDEA